MAITDEEHRRNIAQKPQVSDEALARYVPRNGGISYRLGNVDIPLFRMTDEYVNRYRRRPEDVAPIIPGWPGVGAELPAPPESYSLKERQTSVRDQLNRAACVSFAVLGCMEARFMENGHNLDLSEQFANWVFDGDICSDSIEIDVAVEHLREKGVCSEADLPFEDLLTVGDHCGKPSEASRRQARYGVGEAHVIYQCGFSGPSIANTDYLEALVYSGQEVVIAVQMGFAEATEGGIFDVRMTREPVPGIFSLDRGHAMLIVGYDRRGALPFFIFKASSGSSVGHCGYFWISYDYIRTFAVVGAVVVSVRADMPVEQMA